MRLARGTGITRDGVIGLLRHLPCVTGALGVPGHAVLSDFNSRV